MHTIGPAQSPLIQAQTDWLLADDWFLMTVNVKPSHVYRWAAAAMETLDRTVRLEPLYDPGPPHHTRAGIREPNATNNRIERLNGALRERVKVQRWWKTLSTPLAEGRRPHHNFGKPHQALAGQTPSERAGVGVHGENKRLSLKASLAQGETEN